MATTNRYRFLPTTNTHPSLHQNDAVVFELDESDIIFNSSDHFIKPVPGPNNSIQRDTPTASAAAMSLPVNIPDWSKILKGEYRENRRSSESGGDDCDGDDVDCSDWSRVPPHELLRIRIMSSSFSVREGRGRTLKGRDLSRVRNGVWEKIGFQD